MVHTSDGAQPGKLLVIVGATAVGKTALSLQLAQRFDGEVVSADSRLIYRGMDIGTAKPTPAEQAAVPHHLLDVVMPDETLTLGEYQRLAYTVIDEVLQRGRLPILVGGSGQYVRAVVEGWGIPSVAPQPQLRQALEQEESQALYNRLQALDPAAAAKIHPNNRRRTIRALEVCIVSGRPISLLQRKRPPPYDILMLGLQLDRETLYQRIDERITQMIDGGLLDEVRALVDADYDRRLPALSGLGYAQLWDVVAGDADLDERILLIQKETRRFVRHQHNWFGSDERIQWFVVDSPDYPQSAVARVAAWLGRLG